MGSYRLKDNPNGKVSKQVFVDKIKELKALFPTWGIETSKDNMNLLYKHLGYCSDDEFIKGIDEFIKNEPFNPSIATLSKYIKSVNEQDPYIKLLVEPETNDIIATIHEFKNGLTVLEYPDKTTFSIDNENEKELTQEDMRLYFKNTPQPKLNG